jgi:hypothetical protein
MNNEDTRKRVDEIYDTIKSLQEELNKLRSECPHSEYHVGYFSWRPGSMDVVKICNHCNENLGVPTKEEVNEFLNEEKA